MHVADLPHAAEVHAAKAHAIHVPMPPMPMPPMPMPPMPMPPMPMPPKPMAIAAEAATETVACVTDAAKALARPALAAIGALAPIGPPAAIGALTPIPAHAGAATSSTSHRDGGTLRYHGRNGHASAYRHSDRDRRRNITAAGRMVPGSSGALRLPSGQLPDTHHRRVHVIGTVTAMRSLVLSRVPEKLPVCCNRSVPHNPGVVHKPLAHSHHSHHSLNHSHHMNCANAGAAINRVASIQSTATLRVLTIFITTPPNCTVKSSLTINIYYYIKIRNVTDLELFIAL